MFASAVLSVTFITSPSSRGFPASAVADGGLPHMIDDGLAQRRKMLHPGWISQLIAVDVRCQLHGERELSRETSPVENPGRKRVLHEALHHRDARDRANLN